MRLRELSAARPRFGYRRLHVLLQREGWKVNHKKVQRIYTEEGLTVPQRRRKKRVPHERVPLDAPVERGERWAMDFAMDEILGGARFRALTVIDTFTRECHAIHVASSITGKDVATVLSRLAFQHGAPKVITVDNGPEFRGRSLDAWAYTNKVKLDFIRPGRPVENGYIESFNGKLRDECLSAHWFCSLDEARTTIETWRCDYNCERPHSALSNLTPEAYAATSGP